MRLPLLIPSILNSDNCMDTLEENLLTAEEHFYIINEIGKDFYNEINSNHDNINTNKSEMCKNEQSIKNDCNTNNKEVQYNFEDTLHPLLAKTNMTDMNFELKKRAKSDLKKDIFNQNKTLLLCEGSLNDSNMYSNTICDELDQNKTSKTCSIKSDYPLLMSLLNEDEVEFCEYKYYKSLLKLKKIELKRRVLLDKTRENLLQMLHYYADYIHRIHVLIQSYTKKSYFENTDPICKKYVKLLSKLVAKSLNNQYSKVLVDITTDNQFDYTLRFFNEFLIVNKIFNIIKSSIKNDKSFIHSVDKNLDYLAFLIDNLYSYEWNDVDKNIFKINESSKINEYYKLISVIPYYYISANIIKINNNKIILRKLEISNVNSVKNECDIPLYDLNDDILENLYINNSDISMIKNFIDSFYVEENPEVNFNIWLHSCIKKISENIDKHILDYSENAIKVDGPLSDRQVALYEMLDIITEKLGYFEEIHIKQNFFIQ